MENDFHVQWHITNACDLRCRHCYQSDFTPREDLGIGDLFFILDRLRRFAAEAGRTLTLNITGGEPLLSPVWEPLVRRLAALPDVREFGIITNGLSISREMLAVLEGIGPVRLKISAEGVGREAYERYRGEGTHRRFLDALTVMRETSLEKTLMFTLLEENADQVAPLFDFAREERFDRIIVERFIPWGRGRATAGNAVISPARWRDVCRVLLERCGNEPDLSLIAPYRAFMIVRTGRSFELFGAPCVVGCDGIGLLPDGTVLPCRRFPVPLGNLRTQTMREIWEGSPVLPLVRERRFLKGRCRTCEEEGCLGCRAMAYATTGDYCAEDPHCLRGGGEQSTSRT